MNLPLRKIIHVDMDAFFASVEILDQPSLQGRPVLVGGSPQSRGVVCAASYEARKFGIRSAMPCAEAYRRCPQAVFLPPRFERYAEISQQVRQIFYQYTDLVEPLSLDEAWLDVTQNLMEVPSATWIAQRIRQEILSQTGLTASAGVSYNKFLAKLATGQNKPDGLTVVPPQKALDFLAPLPVGVLFGVGKVTGAKLVAQGIQRVRDLHRYSLAELENTLGKMGGQLYLYARGLDFREVTPRRERKSIGIESTFSQDLAHGPALAEELENLFVGLYKRLQGKQQQGRSFTLKVKFSDFTQITRALSQRQGPLSFEQMRCFAQEKLASLWQSSAEGRKIRLLGLSLGQLIHPSQEAARAENRQLQIFDFFPPAT